MSRWVPILVFLFALTSSLAGDELVETRTIADRLEPHIDSVIDGHRHRLRMGLVESVNSKIAALRVQARGYRDPEYFKLKIFQRCSLPDNPWAEIVL